MIKILKLVTGEEIIADIKEFNGKITLDKPCVLHMVPSRTDPQQPQMAMLPYAPYTEDHAVVVNPEHIIWTENPVKELYNQYNSVFGNGIVVAQGSI